MAPATEILIPLEDAGSLDADYTSDAIDVSDFGSFSVELVWTGTPAGTFALEASVTGGAGTWEALALDPEPEATGAAGNKVIDVPAFGFPKARIAYTRTSGTGSLTINVYGRAL